MYFPLVLVFLLMCCNLSLATGRLKISPHDDSVEIGQDGVIGCSTKVPPDMQTEVMFSWSKDQDVSNLLNRVTPASKNKNAPSKNGERKVTIRFYNATLRDSGCYTCMLTEGTRVIGTQKACFLVYALPNVTFVETRDNFSCSVTSFPKSGILLSDFPQQQDITTVQRADGRVTVTTTVSKSAIKKIYPTKVTCAVNYYNSLKNFSFTRKRVVTLIVALTITGVILLVLFIVGVFLCTRGFTFG